jgi:hypothetical protein
MDNDDTMHARLAAALQEARAMSDRGWRPPADATLAEAGRLLALLEPLGWRPPEIQVTPDGEISFEWEAGAHGWLQLLVRGDGQLTHSAVLEGDEYGQSEDFGDALPDWAASLVARLMRLGH